MQPSERTAKNSVSASFRKQQSEREIIEAHKIKDYGE